MPWSPAPLPATVCCRRCTRSRCEASVPPSPQPGPVTWEGTRMKDSSQPEAGRLFVACVLSVPECVSVWCVCRCALPVRVGVFNVSLLDWPWSHWRGAGPPKGLQAALPLNSLPSEGALLIRASSPRPWWLSSPALPSLPCWAAPKPGQLLSVCPPSPLCRGWAAFPALPGAAHLVADFASCH